MTRELFELATDIQNEIEQANDLQDALTNFVDSRAMMGRYLVITDRKTNNVVNKVEDIPPELHKALLDCVRDYIKNLENEFDKL